MNTWRRPSSSMVLGSKFSTIPLVYMGHQFLPHTRLPQIIEMIQNIFPAVQGQRSSLGARAFAHGEKEGKLITQTRLVPSSRRSVYAAHDHQRTGTRAPT